MMVGEGMFDDIEPTLRASWRKSAADCRCRPPRAPCRRQMRQETARLRIAPTDTAWPAPAAASEFRPVCALPPLQTTKSTSLQSVSIGSRNGPAGSSRPLPKRRWPSITQISMSRASDGFCRPSSAMITSTSPATQQSRRQRRDRVRPRPALRSGAGSGPARRRPQPDQAPSSSSVGAVAEPP